jgi:hypothetical protein
MKKLILVFIFLLSLTTLSLADQTTDTYRLVIPSENSVDWTSKMSKDIVSIDAIMNMMSVDLGTTSTKAIISRDSTTTLGGQVGRIKLISADGNACYIGIYGGS